MLLSIITVVLNCVDTIERTIKSIVEQDFEDVEYVVIDGGSTDGTIDVIKKYENKISYWVSEPDDGIYYAMNKGISISNGEWIAFMNANDWYESNIFSKLESVLKIESLNIIYGKVNKIENGVKNGYLGISEETDPKEIYVKNLYCHQGMFIRKELFQLLGTYDCSYKYVADYAWNLKAYLNGYIPKFVDICVANFTMGGISSTEKSKDEYDNVIVKNYVEQGKIACFEKMIGRQAFDYYYRHNESVQIYKNLLKSDTNIYIWGTGFYGLKMYEIFDKADIFVAGFLDSKNKNSYYKNKKIFRPEEIFQSEDFLNDKDTIICIASEKYEEDMKNTLSGYGISEQKYIYISQFFKQALEEFCNHILDNSSN